MKKFRDRVRSRPTRWVGALVLVAVVAAFVGGFFVADDSDEVSDT